MIKVFGIVVLYGMPPGASETLKSIGELEIRHKSLFSRLFVQDNSGDYFEYEESDLARTLGIPLETRRSPGNPGLANAYNWALREAAALNGQWLLLLDQDTAVTGEFIGKLAESLEKGIPSSCAAVAPQVLESGSGKTISPARQASFGRMIPLPILELSGEMFGVSCINSCSLISVPFMTGVGGFSSSFPLDMLDHFTYATMAKAGKGVMLLNVQIEHRLSIFDPDSISSTRYAMILDAEGRWVRACGDHSARFAYPLRMVMRAFRHLISGRKGLVAVILQRLLHPRRNDEKDTDS